MKRQIQAFGKPGDVAWGISTSGNSENIVHGMRAARDLGLKTIALTGQGGARISPLCDVLLAAASKETPRIQEVHLVTYHAICAAVEGIRRMVQANGIYRRIRPESLGGPLRPAVFLDRDGVIVEDPGYLTRVEDVRFIEGSLEAIVSLNRAGYLVMVVTNQSGIERGYYGWPEFEAVQSTIEAELQKQGGWFDGVWACPFLGDHPYRQPNPGMLTEAAQMLNVDLPRSIMIGDKPTDMEAAHAAGVPGALLVSHRKTLSTARETRCVEL